MLAFASTAASTRQAPLPLSVRSGIKPTPLQTEVLNGVLSGGGGRMLLEKTGVRMRFEFSALNAAYGLYLQEILGSLTNNQATAVNRKANSRTGNVYESFRFGTLVLPALQPFYDRFVQNKTRIIPSNIGDGFTEISLAFLMMNSGATPE